MSKWGHRLAVSSKTHIFIGIVSTLLCAHTALNARAVSKMILNGHHKEAHPFNRAVTQDEFAAYDIFHAVNILGVLISMALTGAGCKSLKASRGKKAAHTHSVFRKHIFRIIFMVALTGYMTHISKEFKAIIARHRSPHNETARTHHHTRKLEEVEESGELADYSLFTPDATCDALSHTSCKSQSGCTWCNSMAVKSNCYTDDDASHLPGGVFECEFSSVSTEEVSVEEPTAESADSSNEKHHKHNRNQHKKHFGCPMPLLLTILSAAHVYLLHKFEAAQKEFATAGGNVEEEVAQVAAPQVVAPITYSINGDSHIMA
jgi:hypothetical protein